MASTMDFNGVVECPVCNEVYKDPRMMPCGHTFCFSCIETWRDGRQLGEFLTCPFCRQECVPPPPGELPKNFFAVKFLEKMKEHAGEHAGIYCADCEVAMKYVVHGG